MSMAKPTQAPNPPGKVRVAWRGAELHGRRARVALIYFGSPLRRRGRRQRPLPKWRQIWHQATDHHNTKGKKTHPSKLRETRETTTLYKRGTGGLALPRSPPARAPGNEREKGRGEPMAEPEFKRWVVPFKLLFFTVSQSSKVFCCVLYL